MRRIGDRKIDPGHIDDRGAAQGLGQPLRPDAIAFEILAVFSDDRARHERCAGVKPGASPPAMPKLTTAETFAAQRLFERRFETRAIAAARQLR